MRRVMVVIVAAALALAGCGGDADEAEPAAAGSGAPPVSLEGAVSDHGTKTASARMEVELDDFYFGPTYIKATPGQRITVELHNEGDAPHTFTLGTIDEELQPGAKRTITVTAPQSGSVTFTCRFHLLQGMQGAIFVS
ncbi:MAG: cupredoxin domain-containing protein [Acidimicrobiales bacterium]